MQFRSPLVEQLYAAGCTVGKNGAVFCCNVVDAAEDVCLPSVGDVSVEEGGAVGKRRVICEMYLQAVCIPIEQVIHFYVQVFFYCAGYGAQ